MILIQRPMPFLRMERGWIWDGVTYVAGQPPARTFGPGTFFPLGLTREEIARWYWALDRWQYSWEFDASDGVDTDSYTVDYTEEDDPGPPTWVKDETLPLRDRVFERLVAIHKFPSTTEAGTVYGYLNMGLDVVLYDSDTGLHYPAIDFHTTTDIGGRTEANVFYSGYTPTIEITISDQTGDPKAIQLYASSATGSGVFTTALDIKPTGYLATV